MQPVSLVITVGTALLVVIMSSVAVPHVFAERGMPGLSVGHFSVAGLHERDLRGALQQFEEQLVAQPVTLELRGARASRTLAQLGVQLDIPATAAAIGQADWRGALRSDFQIRPILRIDTAQLQREAQHMFADHITSPRNATIQVTPTGLAVASSSPGERVDYLSFEQSLLSRVARSEWEQPVALTVVAAAPSVHDAEVSQARDFAQQLLRDGFDSTYEGEVWRITPAVIRRLLEFVPVADAQHLENEVLGVTFNQAELAKYLTTTVAPDIFQQAQDARFERTEEARVAQFAVPQPGKDLDIEASVASIREQIAQYRTGATLQVRIAEPSISTQADIESLGINTLLASGESNYVGSPRNRIHNIEVGVQRYHGLLLPPNAEFSFNQFLGPVDGEHGFKPELVIKKNMTIPEFGGGLCQVTTTIFRAALHAGLKITARRNHAYPVRYYGTPGFDATIYPPYTDLRFTNNTPGYILIQAEIAGTNLRFDFWGTDDGREVQVEGPFTYDRQPNGAVKARLTQTVTREGSEAVTDTFYSVYKSPDLFPKVVSADNPRKVAPPAAPISTPTPTPHAKPTPKTSPASTTAPAAD